MLGDSRYKFLRIYCWILRLGAAAAFLLSLAISFGLIQSPIGSTLPPSMQGIQPPPGVRTISDTTAILIFAVGITVALGGFAAADFMDAHLDIEQNTREMVELMRLQRREQPSKIDIPYPYANASRSSSLKRYEDTPLGQYSERNRRS